MSLATGVHSTPVPADPAIDAMVAALPKVSLHCHLIGSVSPQTVVDLARRHGVALGRSAADLYDHASYEDLGEFLRVLDVVGSLVRDADDFSRVTYESLTGALLAEWLATGKGIGYAVVSAAGRSQNARVWALVVVVSVTALLLYLVAQVVETAVLSRFGRTAGAR